MTRPPDGKGAVLIAAENTEGGSANRAFPRAAAFATARAVAAFYQMMLAGGTLERKRLISPRMVQYVTRNFTGRAAR